ncbi:uncharacterized protein LOC144143085 [Haemaphysalis longicornis]
MERAALEAAASGGGGRLIVLAFSVGGEDGPSGSAEAPPPDPAASRRVVSSQRANHCRRRSAQSPEAPTCSCGRVFGEDWLRRAVVEGPVKVLLTPGHESSCGSQEYLDRGGDFSLPDRLDLHARVRTEHRSLPMLRASNFE